MSILGTIFTWWNGATIGTRLFSARNGEQVGHDAQGNVYFRGLKPYPKGHPFAGREQRWVIYNGANDASRVPPEWHGWLHGSFVGVPESNLPPARVWEVDYTPNATGTSDAYLPAGALARGGHRAPATGDYEPWSPDQA
ncbi:NADH:ubiquinone oxidoreductase subunit NDUFA12 [Novosphingobium sp.]|uniref:NADH:ubiquinone oxidoreductase subunit NDUFA12 n=1 Tax=Novosphingobium sp. TaxID=1874826 RepID=UPI003D0CC19F